jgi:hypothetical protein
MFEFVARGALRWSRRETTEAPPPLDAPARGFATGLSDAVVLRRRIERGKEAGTATVSR